LLALELACGAPHRRTARGDGDGTERGFGRERAVDEVAKGLEGAVDDLAELFDHRWLS
jgi:hypothetical protein